MKDYIPVGERVAFEIELGKVVRQRCCDCFLVHDQVYRVKNGRLFVIYSRNERATARQRQKRKTL